MGRLQGSRKLVLDSGPGLPGLLSRSHATLHLKPGGGVLLSGLPGSWHIMSSSWQTMPQTQTILAHADHSTNGCYVNDARMEPSQPVSLQDGDSISFGGHRWVAPVPSPHTQYRASLCQKLMSTSHACVLCGATNPWLGVMESCL